MATIFRNSYSVPIPRASYRGVLQSEDQVWQPILLRFTTPPPPLTVIRSPLYTRMWAQGRLTPGESQPNLLLRTLKTTLAVPPTVNAWSNPIRKLLSTSLWDYAQSYTVNLPPPSPTVLPFYNTYGNPRWPVYVQQPPIYRLPPTTGVDQFFDSPGLAPTYDWPVPKGYRYPTVLLSWAQDVVSSELISLVPKPFIPADLPNPKGYAPRHGFVATFPLSLIGQDNFPPGMDDWPNPRGYLYPVSLRTFQQSINYIPVIPFKQSEFPNPIIVKHIRELRTFLQSYETFMLNSAQPFNMTNYPNPKGYPYPIDERTIAKSFPLSLVGQDIFFGAAGETKTYDYPNPLRYKASYACYDPNFGWFIVTVPPPPAMGTVVFRKTFSPVGTGVSTRQRRKDS